MLLKLLRLLGLEKTLRAAERVLVGEAVRDKRCLTISETLGEEASLPTFRGLSLVTILMGEAGEGEMVRLRVELPRGKLEWSVNWPEPYMLIKGGDAEREK